MPPSESILIPVAPLRRLVTVVVVLLLVVGIAWLALSQRARLALAFGGTPAAYIDTTTYQSVVVGNQIFFGKLRIDGDVYLLTDVYTISGSSDTSSGTVQIVKRGSELNGPEEPLVIPGRSVLFFENMRTDSQVVQAIGKIRLGQTSTPAPATATPARTAVPLPSASR